MDKYDEQIAELMALDGYAFEAAVKREWMNGKGLFAPACREPDPWRCDENGNPFIGCLTMIRSGDWHAQTPELTKAIRNDSRLPDGDNVIRKEDLPVFAEWQRRLDKELGTQPE